MRVLERPQLPDTRHTNRTLLKQRNRYSASFLMRRYLAELSVACLFVSTSNSRPHAHRATSLLPAHLSSLCMSRVMSPYRSHMHHPLLAAQRAVLLDCAGIGCAVSKLLCTDVSQRSHVTHTPQLHLQAASFITRRCCSGRLPLRLASHPPLPDPRATAWHGAAASVRHKQNVSACKRRTSFTEHASG